MLFLSHRNLLLFLILITVASSCNVKTKTTKSNKMTKLEKRFSKIDTTAGHRNISLHLTSEHSWNMRISFPDNKPGKKPLVVALHWAGGGDTYKQFSECLAEPGTSSLQAIVIAPDGEFLLWTTKYNEDKIVKLVTMAIKFWNIDPSKVLVTGYSNGGIGSWFFADKHPELFSAGIPIASAYHPEKKIEIPLYIIHGEKDELFNVHQTASYVEKARKFGSNIQFVVSPGLTHYMACDYVDELKKASKWVQKELW